MTIAWMTAEYQYPVGTGLKGLKHKLRIDPAGAHYPDNPDIGRIRLAGTAGRIRTGIGTPVAQKTYDLGFEVFYFSASSISANIC
jgi:hypothetical protein